MIIEQSTFLFHKLESSYWYYKEKSRDAGFLSRNPHSVVERWCSPCSPKPSIGDRFLSPTEIEQLRSMELELRELRYQPGPCRPYFQKHNPKRRKLDRVSIWDKTVQGVAAAVLADLIEPQLLPNIHGYRSEYSCHTALRFALTGIRSSQADFVVRVDIKKCFDNINLDLLQERLNELTMPADLAIYLKNLLHVARTFNGTGKGLPTGWPINPVLLNLYLLESDCAILRFNAFFGRYVDDYLLPVKTYEVGLQQVELVKSALETVGLECGPDKTKVESLSDDTYKRLPFLGHIIKLRHTKNGGNITVILPHRKKIRSIARKVLRLIRLAQGEPENRIARFLENLAHCMRSESVYFSTYNEGRGTEIESRRIRGANSVILRALQRRLGLAAADDLPKFRFCPKKLMRKSRPKSNL